jgi:hypothetical protein
MTLIGTGTTADATVHKYLQGPELIKPFSEAVDDGLLPVFRKFPVVIFGIPLAGIGKADARLAVQILK